MGIIHINVNAVECPLAAMLLLERQPPQLSMLVHTPDHCNVKQRHAMQSLMRYIKTPYPPLSPLCSRPKLQ